MWKWAQGAVASVTGAAEPDYGAEAFEPVDNTVKGVNPFGKLTLQDYKWVQPPQSHVETQTFYFHTDEYYGFAQLIHSNPVNLMYTSQFTFLLRKAGDPKFKVWGSHALEGAEVVDGASGPSTDFKATNFSIKFDAKAQQYRFAGMCGEDIKVDLTFQCVDQGFKIGKDGYSKYGTDRNAPWGTMRHIFWPRSEVTGVIAVPKKQVVLELGPENKALGLFVMALQGMKPHHAAARWNFLDFQGPTTSVAVMEFRTPQSYGSQRSSIGAVVKDGKLFMTAVNVDVEHLDKKLDGEDEANWNVPTGISFNLEGPKIDTSDEKASDEKAAVKVEVSGKLSHRVDRVDVMSELPSYVKRVASGISGTRPFIYQYNNELEVTIEEGEKKFSEKGVAFSEATFIS